MNEIELVDTVNRLETFAAEKGILHYLTTYVSPAESIIMNKELERRGTDLRVVSILGFKMDFKADPE